MSHLVYESGDYVLYWPDDGDFERLAEVDSYDTVTGLYSIYDIESGDFLLRKHRDLRSEEAAASEIAEQKREYDRAAQARNVGEALYVAGLLAAGAEHERMRGG